MSKKFRVPLGLVPLAEDPISGQTGDVYFNTVSKSIKVYDGTAWIIPFFLHTHSYDGDVVEPTQLDGGTPTTVFTELDGGGV